MEIYAAKPSDFDEIFALYVSHYGSPGCTWNEFYPSKELVLEDVNDKRIFLHKKNGEIAVVATLAGGDELPTVEGELPCENPCCISRLAVKKDLQGQGYAKEMLLAIFELARSRGFDKMRLYVSVDHVIAKALYQSLGFRYVTDVFSYERMWSYMEKML